jgi:hypothetical protein
LHSSDSAPCRELELGVDEPGVVVTRDVAVPAAELTVPETESVSSSLQAMARTNGTLNRSPRAKERRDAGIVASLNLVLEICRPEAPVLVECGQPAALRSNT